MPVPNGNIEKNCYKKQRRWSLIGILSKRKKFKKSQDSVDFCPYDGKINNKVAQNRYLELPKVNNCPIEQYTCSPRQVRRCNSLQYTGQVSGYSNIVTSQPKLDKWKSSLQSVHSSNSSSASYSDVGVQYISHGNSSRSLSYSFDDKKNDPESPAAVSNRVPFRCSSEIGHYQNKIDHNQRHFRKPSSAAVGSKQLVGKKIPPPPPPRDPNVKATYYYRNNRLVSRESDSTYFSQGSCSDDNIPADRPYGLGENETDRPNKYYYVNEPPRSRRPIQICDVESLSSESDGSVPGTQSVEEALQELEDIYNSLGLSDEDLLDRAERRDLPTAHQNMRYLQQSSADELDCMTFSNNRVLPKTRRSGVPDIVSDDMAYRRLNKKESKRQHFVPAGSFLLVLPTVYNVDYGTCSNRPPSGEPDVTLDDVVFRNRRQHLNFFKVPDPQPPFGIPLGPIVGAAPSDYLHAVPEAGRYRPTFRPRKSPDTVEDDLAFRALRKENKYKTCADFSFAARSTNPQCGIDDRFSAVQELDDSGRSRRTRNDTHWILKKTPGKLNYFAKNKTGRVRFAVFADDCSLADYPAAGNGPNLMAVKIDHHKPIVLSGFTLNEVDLLSESLFCRAPSSAPQHEPPAKQLQQCLTDPHTASYCTAPPQPLSESCNRSLTAVETDKRSLHVRFAAVKFDRSGFKNLLQPNFSELIRREYVHRYHLQVPESRSNRPNDVIAITAAVDGDSTGDEQNRSDRDTCNSSSSTSDAPVAKDGLLQQQQQQKQPNGTAKARRFAAAAAEPSTAENAPVPAAVSSRVAANCMPNYLEVCLYITVYVYQLLFSVNAYSTLVALIVLVALHVCRRLT